MHSCFDASTIRILGVNHLLCLQWDLDFPTVGVQWVLQICTWAVFFSQVCFSKTDTVSCYSDRFSILTLTPNQNLNLILKSFWSSTVVNSCSMHSGKTIIPLVTVLHSEVHWYHKVLAVPKAPQVLLCF